MATTDSTNLEPVTPAELQRILSNHRLRNKGAAVAELFRHREIAMQDATPVLEMIIPLATLLHQTLQSPKNPAAQRSAQRDYAFLMCVIHYLKLWGGQSSQAMLEESQQTEELAERAEDWRSVVFAISNQAWILGQLGQIDESLAVGRKSLSIAQTRGLPAITIVHNLNNIAQRLYINFKQPEKAL